MPPETKPIPKPADRAASCVEYLEAYGLHAQVPPIHSSDYELCLGNPYSYLIHRRYGLIDGLRWSKALNRGSWIHKRFEFWDLPGAQANPIMEQLFQDRIEEFRQIAKARGIQGGELEIILERERKDFMCSMGWFEALGAVVIPTKKRSALNYLMSPHWRPLGHEIKGVYIHPEYKKCPLVAPYDALLYHTGQNTVWPVDLKTCAGSTVDRLSVVPMEFQLQHYMFVTHWLLQEGVLQKTYNLPLDATLGGMLHIAMQKPTIDFGQNDRDCEEYEHTLTRGPRKGQVEVRRKYEGEPKLENYVARCKRWYRAEGEYQDKAVDRVDDPAINMSATFGRLVLDKEFEDEYLDRVQLIYNYATTAPYPENFPRSAMSLMGFGRLSPTAPLHLCPVADWPEIINNLGLIQQWRDEDLPDNPENMLLEPIPSD